MVTPDFRSTLENTRLSRNSPIFSWKAMTMMEVAKEITAMPANTSAMATMRPSVVCGTMSP